MSRRRLTFVVTLLVAAVLNACASPTAPQPPKGCSVTSGVNTCT